MYDVTMIEKKNLYNRRKPPWTITQHWDDRKDIKFAHNDDHQRINKYFAAVLSTHYKWDFCNSTRNLILIANVYRCKFRSGESTYCCDVTVDHSSSSDEESRSRSLIRETPSETLSSSSEQLSASPWNNILILKKKVINLHDFF